MNTNDDYGILSGGFNLSKNNFYTGYWSSQVTAGAEHDYYMGYDFEIGGLSMGIGFMAQKFTDNSFSNREEIYVNLEHGNFEFNSSFKLGSDDYTYYELAYGGNITDDVGYSFTCGIKQK